ncbi:MAG TPA: M23 family metallopeptidase [Acidimicrobiia bacterium]|nr:M23 family metallopeptidase [Acidimicrobiia bacterium]
MRRPSSRLVLAVLLIAFGPPAEGAPDASPNPRPPELDEGPPDQWSPPVDGPIVRGYEPPQRPFGPQHVGVDFAAPPGSPVRAANDGVVVFAGQVGRSRSVALQHGAARRTTYAYLRRVVVRLGTHVRRGDVLGISGGDGPGHQAGVVHFGYRVNGQPQDPAQLFRPRPPRISLAPLDRPACPSRPKPSAPGAGTGGPKLRRSNTGPMVRRRGSEWRPGTRLH